MQEPQFHLPFFANLLLLLVAARILGEIMERLKQPAMIGEILAGILLGPSVFNLIHRTEDIKVVSELGIFLLVILAGMEIHIDEILRSFKGKNIIISLLAFFLPIISGYMVGSAFQEDYMTSTFIGLCVAITALPVSIRMLMDIGKINSSVGRKIISVAVFDDVLALTILGILLNVKDTDMTFRSMANASGFAILKLIIFIALLAAAYWLIKKTLRKDSYLEELLDR
jgi:Kef-type K+ transport system membrane component KefB